MARWGEVDFSDMVEFQEKLERLADKQEELSIEIVRELANRALAKIVKRTPVGVYPVSSGKVGGTLRRGWTVSRVVKRGKNDYEIYVYNQVYYSLFVEYGHRTINGGYVPGYFMMTISVAEIEDNKYKIAERLINKKIKEVFGK